MYHKSELHQACQRGKGWKRGKGREGGKRQAGFDDQGQGFEDCFESGRRCWGRCTQEARSKQRVDQQDAEAGNGGQWEGRGQSGWWVRGAAGYGRYASLFPFFYLHGAVGHGRLFYVQLYEVTSYYHVTEGVALPRSSNETQTELDESSYIMTHLHTNLLQGSARRPVLF